MLCGEVPGPPIEVTYYKATQRALGRYGRKEKGDVFLTNPATAQHGLRVGVLEELLIPEGVILLEEVEDVYDSRGREGPTEANEGACVDPG